MAIDIVVLGKGQRSPECIGKLLDVWEASVRATHHFLTEKDIVRLAPQAEEALRHIETLWVLQDGQSPVGFMGIQERKIEMLFLSPSCIGTGLGKRLIDLALCQYDVEYVDVNEQNEKAEGFYRHMGFRTFRRDETDEQGNSFPILHMRMD